jgi:hypothetical protein
MSTIVRPQNSYNNETKDVDVAALGHMLNEVELKENAHIIELDDIVVSAFIFRHMFYSFDSEHFNLDGDICRSKEKVDLIPHISFEERTSNGANFNLMQTILANMEKDLGVSRECFDLCCRLELEKELSSIRTLCDINVCSVLCALTWSEILNVLKSKGASSTGLDSFGNPVQHILKISIVFKNPNQDIKDTIVKFRYLVSGITW